MWAEQSREKNYNKLSDIPVLPNSFQGLCHTGADRSVVDGLVGQAVWKGHQEHLWGFNSLPCSKSLSFLTQNCNCFELLRIGVSETADGLKWIIQYLLLILKRGKIIWLMILWRIKEITYKINIHCWSLLNIYNCLAMRHYKNHWIREWLGLERTSEFIHFQSACCAWGCHPSEQAAQGLLNHPEG